VELVPVVVPLPVPPVVVVVVVVVVVHMPSLHVVDPVLELLVVLPAPEPVELPLAAVAGVGVDVSSQGTTTGKPFTVPGHVPGFGGSGTGVDGGGSVPPLFPVPVPVHV
jgi:hypothetical protein